MIPHYSEGPVTLYHGDCLEVLRELPDASIDAVVTDPPYALEFMGRGWDKYTPLEFELWVSQWAAECLRVLKPGGHMLAFGGSRTWHRLAAGIEDAGFEIRDSIAWLYGSGFPKSLDVSKAIDAANGRKFEDRYALGRHIRERREVLGLSRADVNGWFGYRDGCEHWERQDPSGARVPTLADFSTLRERLGLSDEFDALVEREEAERADRRVAYAGASGSMSGPRVNVENAGTPATDAARTWEGWGTALKPAFEPIVVARKPLTGTVAGNVLAYGTGALNIDGARIETDERIANHRGTNGAAGVTYGSRAEYVPGSAGPDATHDRGRWPTNVVLDESQAEALDAQTGTLHTQATNNSDRSAVTGATSFGSDKKERVHYGLEVSGASRFFPTFRYEAKAPTSERPKAGEVQHPTVKPLDLMRWLVRLVTPTGGVILEPFAGSGTTVEAAVLEGFECIAIEREADYLPLIVKRLSKPMQQSLFDDMEGDAA